VKLAIVTGAGQRIGRGLGEALLEQGYHLLLHSWHSFAELEEWTSAHKFRSRVIANVKADLSKPEGQELFCQSVLSHGLASGLDLLVHNASAYYPAAFETINQDSLQEMMQLNLCAPFFVTQRLLPLLRKSASPSVINILDAMWQRPSRLYSHYFTSRGGLAVLTLALAKELAPQIRVNAVAPGIILFQDSHTESYQAHTLSKVPLGRTGAVQDVANAVIFLAENAGFVTGEILAVDGGRSL
jgi:pteridine reductase